MRYHLGIDGGGTKTEALLVDGRGRLAGRGTGPGCNPNRVADGALRQAFAEAVARATGGTPPPGLAAVYAGVAGSSHPKKRERVLAALEAAVPRGVPVEVGSDMVPALWSGTRGAPGIVLVAGTGATAYGEDGRGGFHRAGGWGYLIGDDGSGYALGREAVRAVCRRFDRREEPTLLWRKLASAHGLSGPLDIVPLVYGGERPVFDSLAPLVLEAWREGDPCAREAVERTVGDQAALVEAVYRSLDFSAGPLLLVPRGGLLKPDSPVRPLLLAALEARLPAGSFRVDGEEAPPAFGAALLALRMGGAAPEAADALLGDLRAAGLCPSPGAAGLCPSPGAAGLCPSPGAAGLCPRPRPDQ